MDVRRKSIVIKQSKKRPGNFTLQIKVKQIQKRFYLYFIFILGGKKVLISTIGSLLDENVDLTKDEERISSILNTFFASVFTRENKNDIPVAAANQIGNIESLRRINITVRDVTRSIEKFKVYKTPGLDMISLLVV